MANENAKLEDLLWGAAEFLRGQIDASDYKQYVFPLLFFKRLSDVYDDELEDAKKEMGTDDLFGFLQFHRFEIQAKQVGKPLKKPPRILVKPFKQHYVPLKLKMSV